MEYTIEANDDAWIRIKNFNVHLHKTAEGIVVDIWGNSENDAPITSTYAFDSEVDDYLEKPIRSHEESKMEKTIIEISVAKNGYIIKCGENTFVATSIYDVGMRVQRYIETESKKRPDGDD